MDGRKDLLAPVRELLSSPERWIQGALARAEDGVKLYDREVESGVCWCLEGAIRRFYPSFPDYYPILDALSARAGTTAPIFKWNDAPGRTFDDIQALLAEPLWAPTNNNKGATDAQEGGQGQLHNAGDNTT